MRKGGLRIYLERPWYSSGEGELLGLVLLDASPTPSQLSGIPEEFDVHSVGC